MKLKSVKIHNFRSIIEAEFLLDNFSLLVGENNSGKTNIITALRIFYEDGIKFDENIDFPKLGTNDNESWIELNFLTTQNEQSTLPENYKSSDNILRVCKYLKSEKAERVKKNNSNIFAYESGSLSDNQFFGAKNISESKLGSLIYIPELSKSEDNLKLTGPSPLRNMINFVVSKVIAKSKPYTDLQQAFSEFNKNFPTDSSQEGFSIKEITNEINKLIEGWGITFGLEINPISQENITKELISHYIEDKQLGNQRIPINCYGQGLQRQLIYTLIRINAKYVEKHEIEKKVFSPDFLLILFEEPEAFLHPTQQEIINIDLHKISKDPTQQVVCTTHSPIFVSKNIEDLSSIIKVNRKNGITTIFQINNNEITELLDENNSMFKMFTKNLEDASIPQEMKDKITKFGLGDPSTSSEEKLEEESLKYFLWLDNERSCSFFAKHVFICEGASEKILFDYLVNTIWDNIKSNHIYFLDALGKFNLHRYMNLYNKLGISHSVIYDKDKDRDIQEIINNFIEVNKNPYTKGIFSFENDIESFLGIEKPSRRDLKPLNIIMNYQNNKIEESKVDELKGIIESLLPK